MVLTSIWSPPAPGKDDIGKDEILKLTAAIVFNTSALNKLHKQQPESNTEG